MSRIDFDSAILGARFCDGGHAVNGEDSEPLPLTQPEPPRYLPTPEAWFAIAGAALGFAAAVYAAWPFFF